MPRRAEAVAPRWVWGAEVMRVVEREMARGGLSLGELARRAGHRFGVDPESAERRLRAARGPGAVMDVHTADRYLTLVGRHLTDLPCYRDALRGDLPPERWPRRVRSRRAPRSPRPAARAAPA